MITRDDKELFWLEDDKLRGFDKKSLNNDNNAFVLPEGVQSIGAKAFYYSEAAAFVIPDGVTKIGEEAFCGCKNLKMVFIPKSVEVIETEAFLRCNNLTVYCEEEPKAGWLNGEPTYKDEYVTTAEDYAHDFHGGGVSSTRVTVTFYNNWNPEKRPVVCNCTRQEFMKRLAELTQGEKE